MRINCLVHQIYAFLFRGPYGPYVQKWVKIRNRESSSRPTDPWTFEIFVGVVY